MATRLRQPPPPITLTRPPVGYVPRGGVVTRTGSAAEQLAVGWAHGDGLAAAHHLVVLANYGTAGSLPHYGNRQMQTILPVPEPRRRLWNGLLPIVWRLRVLNADQLAAVAAKTRGALPAPVVYTEPGTASLLADGRLP